MTIFTRRLALFLSIAAGLISAAETKVWSQNGHGDFENATLKGVALRSDGRMALAPRIKELFDAGTPFLWTIAQDSKNNVYAAGGGSGGSTVRIYRVDAKGNGTPWAEIEGTEIHGLAIDKQDRVYAASQPDGKVWRIGPDGKPSLFYDPKSKYIWSLAFAPTGELYIATGDPGAVHRVGPDGKGAELYRLDDAHARSLAIDVKGRVLVGTEPSGLIVQVSASGEGFVLYQTSKREVTAVAAAPDGRIFASSAGTKSPLPAPGAPVLPPTSAPPSSAGMPANPTAVRAAAQAIAPAPPALPGANITGGSELVEIAPDGAPRVAWSHPTDVVYSVTVDPEGAAIVGTGNKGMVYRIESATLYTQLFTAPGSQVTALMLGRSKEILAVTANVGRVLSIGPEREPRGTVESDVFDAAGFSRWGRLLPQTELDGGTISFETRSGNLERPQRTWSPWAPLKDGRVTSPPARFLQWRATLTAAATGSGPKLSGASVAWLSKNIAPEVTQVEATPANYRFPAPTTSVVSAKTLALPALGTRSRQTPPTSEAPSSSVVLTYAKGFGGIRWAASDDNGDRMMFKVEIRGTNETVWKLMKDQVRERFLTFDATAFPDGEYVARVTATDSPDNPPADALMGALVSAPFRIDNTAPVIEALTAQAEGTGAPAKIRIRFRAVDQHSWISKAEYSINGVEWVVVNPATALSDSKSLGYDFTIERPQPGETTIAVRVSDEADNQATAKALVK